jgi:hypothetical protein
MKKAVDQITCAEKAVVKLDKKIIKDILKQAEKIRAKTLIGKASHIIVDSNSPAGKLLIKSWYKENSLVIERGFAIKGVHGLYVGWNYHRGCMVSEHCNAKGKTWKQCKKNGDKVIKIEIRELPAERESN